MVLYAGPEATVPPAELELMKGGKSYHTTSHPKLIEKEDCAGLRYLCPASAEEDDDERRRVKSQTSRPAKLKMDMSGGVSCLKDKPAS